MNKIFKVIYSKTRHCYVVVSELAKSHVKSSHGNGGQQKAALTMSVLLALGAFTFAFGPVNAEAADENHYTEGQQYIGVYHTSNDNKNAENHQAGVSKNQGALDVGAISIGVHAQAGTGTITIGNRLAPTAQDSVFIGSKYDVAGKVYTTASSKVVSIGADSNASGTGSVALGYGAAADVSNVSGEGKNPDKESQSIAIGYLATAKQNNIALGANSVATAAASTLGTAKFREASAGDYNAPSSYISVGSDTVKRRITNVAAGSDDNDVATVGQLSYVEQEAKAKGSWKLTAGGANESTVEAGSTVDFSAGSDGNLSVSKDKTSNKVTIGLNKDVILGKAAQGEGGSLSVYQDPSSTDKENGNDQMGSHVRIDGSTVSIRYPNGTKDSDARGVVLGVAKDSSNPLGYMYLADGKNHYYVHGTMANDPKALQGRLVYNSSLKGYNYIANLEDGISFSGDAVKAGSTTTNTTADTRLDPTAANHTLSIQGGVTDTTQLTSNNIGVVTTPTEYDGTLNNGVNKAGGLTIQLAKDLKGITSIANGADGSGAKITLSTNGTTISGGDVNVSKNKITGLKDGTDVTDAATVGQVDAKIKAANKYYSVKNGVELTGNTNEDNLGASAIASMAAGYTTGTAGIASTVVGSYSGVMNMGTASGIDYRGATAVSLGTVNVNNNTDTSKIYSGVANSIVGQANMTTDSNAAIIVGAGNSVTNSYRKLDKDALSAIKSAGSVSALKDALQDAVPKSGAQVMVMGGGNNVESAYMSQVVGVGNTVTGADSTYAEGTSTQYNFVDGFQNELTNGKNDYIIGSNNSVTGDSIDKNQSNIVVGDNHTLTNRKNNVVIGSADKKENKNKELTASDATVIGHNADVTVDGGVAIGSGSVSTATDEAYAEGYDPVSTAPNKASTNPSATWKATTGAVSIGANGTTTRRITNLAAGFNDTDAVNVAQIKKLASINASNIGVNLKKDDGTAADATDITNNKNAWAEAIGTGTVTKDDNGSKQLVTGGTVYKALHDGGLDKIVIGTPGKDGKDGTAGTPGTIGLVGPAGKDGKNTEVDITIQKGTDDADKGIKGQNGVDGKNGITRIVYGDGDDQYQVATLDDGLVFAGDTGDNAAVKLNHQVKLSGTTFDDSNKYDKNNWTSDNIAVVSDKTDTNGDAVLKLQLAKDLKGMNSTEYTSEEKTGEGDQQKTTTTINSKGLTITDGPSITKDGIDAGNKAITQVASGLGNDSQGSYNKEQNGTNAANLNDVNKMITDAAGGTGTIGKELAKKANVDASNIGENMQDADGSKASTDVIKANKDAWGKAIGTNEIKEGNSQLVTSDAVARGLDKKADKNSVYTKDETYNRTQIDNKISNISTDVEGKANTSLNNITPDGQNVIKDQARDAVKISNTGRNTSVVATPDATKHTTTYTVNVEGNGKVAVKDMGLISGDTLYNELRPSADGSYIKQTNTTAQNLTSLDTQVRATHDLINSDGKTIKIGGSDAATKIDVSGKDSSGNSTTRVITGVQTDPQDAASAANVGYVNDVTAASTQQVYRDMNRAYGSLNNNINRAAAGSNALAALHPLDFDPADKASFAFGYGHYRNANAGAFGAFYQPNANTMVNFGITVGNGDPGFNAGVSFKIGKGSAYNGVSKAEMAQTIHDQATEISAIKADDAAKDKRIDALEKENQEMKKQIQEILARLNG